MFILANGTTFILNNFYYERQIMIDNQYYYICFKLCFPIYFLSDYWNLILLKKQIDENLL